MLHCSIFVSYQSFTHLNRTFLINVLFLIANIIILKVILAGLYVLVLFPAAWLLQYEWSIFPMILAVGINQILISLLFYMRSNVSGLGFYRTDSLLSALEKLLMILVCGILLYVPAFKENFRIEWFIYAQMGALLIATLTAYLIVRKHLPKIKWRYNPLYLRIILRECFQMDAPKRGFTSLVIDYWMR